ncbi:MAG: response regulator [Calditrichaeota bacterium]|nr:MAG: response regulator [Calditrichota bacterium]
MSKKTGRILVIDDEEVIRSGCRQILEMYDYHVDEAANGREGLQKLMQNEYDVVLTDMLMPEMDGMQLLEEINQSGKQVIIIVITGYATIENAINAGRKGAFDYLPKPFNSDELLAKVERAIDYRDHLQEIERLREERDRNLLESSNERARTLTIINSMSEGVLATNRQHQIVLMNPMASRMMHISEARAAGRRVEEIIRNPDLQRSIIDSLEQVTSTLSCTHLEFDTVYGRAIQASITPVIDENKACIGTVTVLIDVSEEKKVEKMKSDFVSYVAHELKAPLGAIEGYLNIILDGIIAANPQKEREMIEKSRDRAHGLIALINDLLDLSRIDRKRSLKAMGPINIVELLQETVDFYKNRAESKSLAVNFSTDDDLPFIRGNKEDLSRLFANLVSNAIKYTPENGHVDISVQKSNSHLFVNVADSGIGIPAESLTHIFDEFFRAKNAMDKKITGTGLGLSIARKIAKDHQGDIEVESQENVGSTFRVTLPIIAEN